MKKDTRNNMRYSEEKRGAENYFRNKKNKAWNFPFRDAFIRAGIIKE